MKNSNDSVFSFFALVICGFVLLSLGSLFLRNVREISRRDECQNNLKRLTLGVHNYHSAFKRLPPGCGGSTGGSGHLYLGNSRQSNQGRLTGFAGLLPFIEQQALWSALSNRKQEEGFPAMGPSPSYDHKEYKLWSVQVDVFICPSDKARRRDYGLRSYMMNYGDAIEGVGRLYADTNEEKKLQAGVCRGAFMPGKSLRFRDIIDGISNTIMLGETKIGIEGKDAAAWVARDVSGIVNEPAVALKTLNSKGQYQSGQAVWAVGKGSRWPEGSFAMNAITTVLPPNGPSATVTGDPESGCITASSYHRNGVYVAMCDGAVIFVSDTIDTGNLNAPSVTQENDNLGAQSPYGVWGALGTRANKEIIPSEREANYEKMR